MVEFIHSFILTASFLSVVNLPNTSSSIFSSNFDMLQYLEVHLIIKNKIIINMSIKLHTSRMEIKTLKTALTSFVVTLVNIKMNLNVERLF